ncbi:hypothetical protein BU23DRAFT_61703 [Bimuria novae-zelandiae CBS 107.79]|uniref:Uncharacterized protein n=1 Tax=Bimuria novae-zelandiae CBS 107.79 TaxID=1447943 RepID=A0A6A5UL14_9PLEO|nr:hypothetical protein BU23DRAFT_61703 [Bimuria novae-zelandiae CBS 107.79]
MARPSRASREQFRLPLPPRRTIQSVLANIAVIPGVGLVSVQARACFLRPGYIKSLSGCTNHSLPSQPPQSQRRRQHERTQLISDL